MTTHLLEEADKADRIAIMHRGQVVAEGGPNTLRNSLGGQVLTIQTAELEAVGQWLVRRAIEFQQLDGQLRVADPQAADLVAPLSAEFGPRLQAITLGQPSLEDVFVARTGHQFLHSVAASPKSPPRTRSH
jgi:ABC-2 type transport system ATP-binding protein